MDKCRWTKIRNVGKSKERPLFNGDHYKTECGFNIIATKKSLKNNGFCDDCGKPIEVANEAKD